MTGKVSQVDIALLSSWLSPTGVPRLVIHHHPVTARLHAPNCLTAVPFGIPDMLSPNRIPYVLRLHPFGLDAVGHDTVCCTRSVEPSSSCSPPDPALIHTSALTSNGISSHSLAGSAKGRSILAIMRE